MFVFPTLHYNGWLGSPVELKNRLLSVIDYTESPFYGDVAANALDLALNGPTTPRSSHDFLDNLNIVRLTEIYKDDPRQLRRVLKLDKTLLQQVELRYQVFFSAMAGQIDGTLDYADADAVYLRVRGFTLRNEAPRLGRFLASDFANYLETRRRAGVQTLFIIDEFNALNMRDETKILFQQCRSYRGCLLITAQGYAGIIERAGKRLRTDTSYSVDEEGNERKNVRPRWDFKVPVNAVLQQEQGQAYWIYHGHTQQSHTLPIPVTSDQVAAAWREIRSLEALQRQLDEQEAQRRRKEQEAPQPQIPASIVQPKPAAQNGTPRKPAAKAIKQPELKRLALPASATPPVAPEPPPIPPPDPDDDGPDRIFG